MITTTPRKSAEKAVLTADLPVAPPRRAPSGTTTVVEIRSSGDIITARQRGRLLALELGFSGPEVSVIMAAISEVARNIVQHAEAGELEFAELAGAGRRGLRITARDHGPGILDAERVAAYGHDARPAVGLPGVRLLMDEFEIESTIGCGTTVTMKKWLR